MIHCNSFGKWPIALLVAICLVGDPLSAFAQRYQLEIIAQPGDAIDERTITRFSPEDNLIAINNNRQVAFMASVDGR